MDSDIRSKYKNIEDYSTILKVDEFGFIISLTDCDESKENLNKIYKNEWKELLDSYCGNLKDFQEKIKSKRLLQRGVPSYLRKKIWRTLLIKDSKKITSQISKISISNLIFKKVLQYRMPVGSINEKFEILKVKTSEYDYQIHVDIQRTFRQHYLFHSTFGKGQLELFNLLVAFANSFKEVGYCQGMSDIAAVFLIHFSEKEAFEMMSTFFKINRLEKIFDKNFSKLPHLLKMQINVLSAVIPEIHSHLINNVESLGMCFITWYLTLFTRFPIKLALMIWDFMMLYGIKVVIYFVSAILHVNKKNILNMKGENLLIYLNGLQDMKIDDDEMIKIVDTAVSFLEMLDFKHI